MVLVNEETIELYKRQKTLGLGVPEEVFIVGTGGTGTWVGIILAMIGVPKINLSDDDIIERHNLSRLPFPEESIGKKKTEVLKDFINTLRPECEVITYEGIHNESDMFKMAGVVFDCNDDIRIQELIYKFCKKFDINYISVGCNANHITVTSSVEQLWGPGGDRYTETPMFIVPPMLSSLCAVWNVVKNRRKVDFLISIHKMFTEQKVLGDVPLECNECPLSDSCEGCTVHVTEQHEICSCCPISLK